MTHDGGQTWTDDHDIGASVGVVRTPSSPRPSPAIPAAPPAPSSAPTRPATSGRRQLPRRLVPLRRHDYDGGQTWTTVNATPNDPVQGAGGICTRRHLAAATNRNLLDFNEITIDDQGRVLFGYADGCVSADLLSSGGAPNDYVAFAKVARQTGGKSLYAQYDPVEPATPKAPYLDGIRYSSKADPQLERAGQRRLGHHRLPDPARHEPRLGDADRHSRAATRTSTSDASVDSSVTSTTTRSWPSTARAPARRRTSSGSR